MHFFGKDKDKDRLMRQINVEALKKRTEVGGQVWQAGKTNAFCEWRSGGCKMEDGAGTQTLAFSRKQQRYLWKTLCICVKTLAFSMEQQRYLCKTPLYLPNTL